MTHQEVPRGLSPPTCQGRDSYPPDRLTILKNAEGPACTESFRSTSGSLFTADTCHSFILILTPRRAPPALFAADTVGALLPPLPPAPCAHFDLTPEPAAAAILEVSASQLAGRRAGPRDRHPTETAPTRRDGNEAVSTTAPSPLRRPRRCLFSGFRSFLPRVKLQGPALVPGAGPLPAVLLHPLVPQVLPASASGTAPRSSPATGAASTRAKLRRRRAESSSDAPQASQVQRLPKLRGTCW